MINVVFKDLEASELARQLATERLQALVDEFPELRTHLLVITLSMNNSPNRPGPDLFSAYLRISGQKYRRIHLRKSSRSLYIALNELCKTLLEIINRSGDRNRVEARTRSKRPKLCTNQTFSKENGSLTN